MHAAEATHRDHAIVEQAIADLTGGSPARPGEPARLHLPEHLPRADAWQTMFTAADRPPVAAA